MKRLSLISFAIVIFGLLASISVLAGQSNKLRIGQTKRLGGNVRVKFIEVTEDSRCPVGVDCIWAGRAIVRLDVRGRNGRSRTADLEVGSPGSTVIIDGMEIKVSSLVPHPKADKKTSSKEYVATVEIQRKSK